jgi:deoxyribodipyrimidine photo-lyase
MTSVMWFRRDLRLGDHPALLAAAAAGPVAALFVLDEHLLRRSGPNRTAFLLASLRALDDDLRLLGGRLLVRHGDPSTEVAALAHEVAAEAVHISEDFAPYGRARDAEVEGALRGVPLVRTGSPYAVSPGRVQTKDGGSFKVFTAFYRAWQATGWRAPASGAVEDIAWITDVDTAAIPDAPAGAVSIPAAGERAALDAWHRYLTDGVDHYADLRDRPDLDATSRMSPYLKVGAVHPRTLLADLGARGEVYRKELAWREFYAAVLAHWPDSARHDFDGRMASMHYDGGRGADERFEAWAAGRTGYPIVDAGMRQLLAEGWMHNRVRMITASFLTKDLHLPWWRGARHFMGQLIDGDLASNQHGWQWTAGTGTDAAPYFRVFNPVSQGLKFDPAGDYVRRYVPELRDIPGAGAHEPWQRGVPAGYPERIVDHAAERAEALSRYAAVSAARRP